jgi:phage tail-like protein
MPTGERVDPYRAFNFRLEIDGLELASFSECSGVSGEGEAVDYREGTDRNNSVRKLPGLRTYTNITLKRGITQNDELFRWYTNIANGFSDRRNGTVILMNEEHEDVVRWNFENAFVNKYEGATMNASGNEVAVETVELVHEKLTMEIT